MAGGNTATQIYDRDETKKEEIKIKPTIEMPTDTKFEDMYRKAIDSPMSSEETTKMRKRHNKQRALAAIIDGVSALGNVYFASRGAGANGITNFSGAIGNRWREYWDKVRTDRDAYNKGLLQARQMDYNANIRKLERAEDAARRQKEREEDRAERTSDKNREQRNWDLTFNAGREDAAHARGMDAARLGIQQTQAKIASMKARGENVAWDENGNPHYFTDPKAADDFARSKGTYVYDDVVEEIEEPGMTPGSTKKTKKTKKVLKRINPLTYVRLYEY